MKKTVYGNRLVNTKMGTLPLLRRALKVSDRAPVWA